MYKPFTLLAALFTIASIQAQNVGIGIPSPVSKLHVRAGSDSVLILENSQNLATGITNSMNFKTSVWYTGGIRTIGESSNHARMGFYVGTQLDYTLMPERVTILNSGNVGISATIPTSKLQIGEYSTNPNDTYLTIKTSGGNQYKAGLGLYHLNDNNGWLLESDHTNNTFSIRHRNGAVFNNPAFTIDLSERVGIGSVNPTTKLQVGDYSNNPNDTYITVKTVGGGLYKAGLGFYHYNDSYGWLLESDETDQKFSIRHRNGSVFNNPALTIDWFENVGIGSVSPTTKLQVGDYSNGFNNYITVKTAAGTYKSGLGFFYANDNFGWLLESDQNSGTFSIRHRNSLVFNNPVITINPQDNVGINQTPNTDSRLAITSGNNSYGLTLNGTQAQIAALNVNGKSIFSNNVIIGAASPFNPRLTVTSANNDYGLFVDGSNASNAGLYSAGKSFFYVGTKQLVVYGTASGNPTNYFDSYPLLVEGAQQGIAVHINSAAAHEGNNYLYFADNSYIRGSVAGQNIDELHNSFDYLWYQGVQSFDAAFILAEGIACGIQLDLGEVAVMAVEGAEFIVKWAEEAANMENGVGVVYQSNAADYAEWLEREDANEQLEPGMIVGVNGGRVSRRTAQTKQLMVISTAPLVLGNTPPEGRSSAFEKVAFMGQVPVRVRGKADMGDYILASGENDGVGIAVAPTKMRLEDYDRVVGVAWSSSRYGNGESLVKTAVGLNTHDLIGEIKQQKTEVQQLRETLGGIMAYLKEKDPSFKLDMPAGQASYAGPIHPNVSDQPQPEQVKKPIAGRNLNDVYNMLRSHPEFVDDMLKRAKEICIARGMNVNTEFAKELFDREAFYQRFEKAMTYKVAPQKLKTPVISEPILKRFGPTPAKD